VADHQAHLIRSGSPPGARDDNVGAILVDPLHALQSAAPRTATATLTLR
jgi:hypothetical protein